MVYKLQLRSFFFFFFSWLFAKRTDEIGIFDNKYICNIVLGEKIVCMGVSSQSCTQSCCTWYMAPCYHVFRYCLFRYWANGGNKLYSRYYTAPVYMDEISQIQWGGFGGFWGVLGGCCVFSPHFDNIFAYIFEVNLRSLYENEVFRKSVRKIDKLLWNDKMWCP